MRRPWVSLPLAALTLLFLCSCNLRGDITIKGDTTVQPWRAADLTAESSTNKSPQCIWKVVGTDASGKASVPQLIKVGARLIIVAKPGTYTVSLTSVDFDKKTIEEAETVVTFQGDLPPVPPGPVPPGPVPPGPTPTPAPIPTAGFRVLMVYESADLAKLPPAQQAVLYDKGIRDYLRDKCVLGPDGKTKEFRIYDQNVDMSADTDLWKEAMKRKRDSVPWIVVSNHPKGGYEGPLPATVADTMTLLKKYSEMQTARQEARKDEE